MTLTIELPTEAERQLRERAAGDGVDPAQLAARLVRESLTAAAPEAAKQAADALAQMFAQWEADDPVAGPDDSADRQRELDEFKAGMNAASTRGHPIFP